MTISQASFLGDQISMSKFESLKNIDQNLILLIINDDQMIALWNQLYQFYADSNFMGVVDCQQANDLCSVLNIKQTPQLLFVNKTEKILIYFDGQWNLESITEWLGRHHQNVKEEQIQVGDIKINQIEDHNDNNIHESQDYNNHIHDDNHSENIEKLKYEELHQLYLINEQLSYRTEKLRRDIDLVKHQTNILNTSIINQLNRQETSINFTIYLFSSGMIAFVCVLFTLKKINILNKKQSILVQ